jgi:Ca2+-binding EF-hand superfamily protein
MAAKTASKSEPTSIKDDFKRMFELRDTDFDGLISRNQVIEIANSIEYTIDNSIIIDDFVDVDGFLKLFDIGVDIESIGLEKEALSTTFKKYDTNNNGTVLVAHLIQMINESTGSLFDKDALDEMLREFDIDEAGYVKYQPLLDTIKN